MFAAVELARRIEATEANATAAIGAAARDHDGRDVVLEAIGGGVALFVQPDSPMNKAIGFGFDGALDEPALARVEAAFAARGARLQCEVATLARCEVFQQLAGRGYRLMAFENVLGCAPAVAVAAAPRRSAVAIDRVGEAGFDDWGGCIADGFLAGDGSGAGTVDAFARESVLDALRQLRAVPGIRRYLARQDGQVAGAAGMRIDGGVAQLTGAATLPAFRRRGVQQALLARRLQEAAAAGCDVAVITTQPGSISQQNSQRQGFALLYARAILLRPPA